MDNQITPPGYWNVGDDALCIKSGDITRIGAVYTVCEVIMAGERRWSNDRGEFLVWKSLCLRFKEVPHKDSRSSSASRFVKVPKLTPEEYKEALAEFESDSHQLETTDE